MFHDRSACVRSLLRTSRAAARLPMGVALAATLLVLPLGGCASSASGQSPTGTAAASTPAGSLEGTDWRLVGFQSMDDAQGTSHPVEGRTYTLSFGSEGSLAMTLDCNRGHATWSASPSGSEGGSMTIGMIASTRALCAPVSGGPDMARVMGAHLPEVASYTLRDGHLFLALKMDGGIFEFAPL